MIHASFRALKNNFGFTNPVEFCGSITGEAGPCHSITMPAFTYSFANRLKSVIPFDRLSSKAATGVISETFRCSQGVFRTSSPTHSFSVFGKHSGALPDNNPVSPLGAGSVCEKMFDSGIGVVALVGCGFESLTMLHYFESKGFLPYMNKNPWHYMGVEPVAVSTGGCYPVIELPGCSKGFIRFEAHLIERGVVKSLSDNLKFYILDISTLWQWFVEFTRNDPYGLLCETGCPACFSRRYPGL